MNEKFSLSIFGVLLVLIVFLLSNILTGIPFAFTDSSPEEFMKQYPVMMLLMQVIPFLAAIIFAKRVYSKRSFFDAKFTFSKSVKFNLSIVAVFISIYFVSEYLLVHVSDLICNAISGITTFLDLKMKQEVCEYLKEEMEGAFELLANYPVIMFLMTCVAAPILEEILFRGIIQKGLIGKGMSPMIAILISAFIFGVVHLNPWQFVVAILLGFAMGYVYHLSGSLLYPIIIHFVNNTMAFFVYLNTQDFEFEQMESVPIYGLFIGLGFLVLSLESLRKSKV